MFRKTMVISSLIAVLVAGMSTVSMAEEPKAPAADAGSIASASAEILWVWGEIVSVDSQAKKITVKYLDYDTDMEKEIGIVLDDKTKLEGASTLVDLKPQDTVSIDYSVVNNANVAAVITVERLEDIAEEPKEDLQPLPIAAEPAGTSAAEPAATVGSDTPAPVGGAPETKQ